jgi:hypothetical protein
VGWWGVAGRLMMEFVFVFLFYMFHVLSLHLPLLACMHVCMQVCMYIYALMHLIFAVAVIELSAAIARRFFLRHLWSTTAIPATPRA